MGIENINPVIVAAVVSSSIAFISGIIQTSLVNSKKQKEEKVHYETLLRDKLLKAYSPLYMLLQKGFKEKLFINEEIVEIIQKEGHLISFSRIEDFREIIALESRLQFLTDREKDEYRFLKDKILLEFKIEFEELHDAFNQSFINYKRKYSLPIKAWIENRILKTTLWSTMIFWGVFLIFSFINSSNAVSRGVINSILYIWAGLSIIISVIFLAAILIILFQVSFRKTALSNKFMGKDYVPLTGSYKCTACGEVLKLTKNQRFGECVNKGKLIHRFLAYLMIFEWKRNLGIKE